MLCTKSYLGDWVKRDGKDKTCCRCWGGEVGRREGKRPLGRLMLRLENNINFFIYTAIPRLTKIIRSGITFVS